MFVCLLSLKWEKWQICDKNSKNWSLQRHSRATLLSSKPEQCARIIGEIFVRRHLAIAITTYFVDQSGVPFPGINKFDFIYLGEGSASTEHEERRTIRNSERCALNCYLSKGILNLREAIKHEHNTVGADWERKLLQSDKSVSRKTCKNNSLQSDHCCFVGWKFSYRNNCLQNTNFKKTD